MYRVTTRCLVRILWRVVGAAEMSEGRKRPPLATRLKLGGRWAVVRGFRSALCQLAGQGRWLRVVASFSLFGLRRIFLNLLLGKFHVLPEVVFDQLV